MNTQTPEKRTTSTILDVHSIFLTIQGEGPFCGHPAVFVRLAGCNLQCPGCDTDYTSGRTEVSADYVVRVVKDLVLSNNSAASLVVITGGEPFRQNIVQLVKMLMREGYTVQIETNGTLKVPDEFPDEAVIICSPKTDRIHHTIAARATAFKYVVRDNDMERDGLPREALCNVVNSHVARPTRCVPIYVQPMDEQDPDKNKSNLNAAIQSCLRHNYILQVQVHKIIDME